MTISIWRYSHLVLAISSSVFIFLASVTGIILALEPISENIQPFAIPDAKNQTLAKTISTLQNRYDEVFNITLDENDFVSASVITKEGNNESFYINPFTGEKVGELITKKPIFEFATNLHRSLFLKSTGRFIVGLFSFFLLLISITGLKLIFKRQGGFKGIFSKVIKENTEQYYHVVFGKYTFIPIIIVTLTGVYLSLEKFNVLPNSSTIQIQKTTQSSSEKKPITDFEIFKSIILKDVKTVEFPFSTDEEDYFILELHNKELYVNQYTGEILSEGKKPLVKLLSVLSMQLHTGKGSITWSLVLLIVCVAILFFIYSGFTMTFKRLKNKTKTINQYKKEDAEYVILVGSETGNTNRFANLFKTALINSGKSVFIDQLNNYSIYNKAEHIVVFTSTYGEGEAPTSAKYFFEKLQSITQNKEIIYSVVGFGSLMYPDYCKYAIDVDELLETQKLFKRGLEIFKINNQSIEAFKSWMQLWNNFTKQELKVVIDKPKINRKKLQEFKVNHITEINKDATFIIALEPLKKIKFQSGDLVGFYPEKDNLERLYSIGKINDTILLSVKKHQFGICSSWLSNLKEGNVIKGKIKCNLDFHLSKTTKKAILISNGTGIAPFLGMISSNNNVEKYLFWGGRQTSSINLYSHYINNALKNNQLKEVFTAFSQEQEKKVYVQDIVKQREELVCDVLNTEGIIMICGSIAMQNAVLEILNNITVKRLNKTLSMFENNEQIKLDCY